MVTFSDPSDAILIGAQASLGGGAPWGRDLLRETSISSTKKRIRAMATWTVL
jgi:hypothetical protein